MTEIRFYHLTRRSVEQALPELLEKTLQKGWRAVVCVPTSSAVEPLTKQLWAEPAEGFLPHGNEKDGQAELQPIWITEKEENPNKAEVLFLLSGAKFEDLSDFTLVCEVFDGEDDTEVVRARQRWKAYKETDLTLTYWQQTEVGWEKKG